MQSLISEFHETCLSRRFVFGFYVTVVCGDQSLGGRSSSGRERIQGRGSTRIASGVQLDPRDQSRPFFQSDSKAIVHFEKEKSSITSFGGDKGTDFLKVKKRYSNKSYTFGMEQESESRKALLTTLESDAIPQSGAKTIKVNGEVVLSVASKSELKKSGKADIKVGEKFEVARHTFTIEKAGKPKWGEDKLEVTLESSVDLKSYRKVVFYDAEGKEVESKRGMWSSMGMFGKKTYKTSFTFKEEPKQLVLGLDEWTDLEAVKVPLDLTVGAGL